MILFPLIIFFVLLVAAVSFIAMASRSAVKTVGEAIGPHPNNQRQAIGAAMAPVKALREQVVNGITYADTYLDLLPASEHKTAALTARQEAARNLEMAGTLAPNARTPQDFARMEAVLQQANDDAQKSRSEIDIATGGTGVAVGINGTDFHATPATASGPAFQSAPIQTDIQASLIPENERSVCFFCSRPARVSDLTAVNFVVNGQRRKVLACADDARTIQQGAAPQIQSINENGQQVPWFRSQSYNPYRDYGHQPNAGAGGNFAHPSGGFGSTAGISHGIAHSSAQTPPQPGYYGGGYGYGYGANYNWYSDMIFMNMLMASEPVPYPVYVDSGGMMTDNPAYAMAPPIDNFNNSYDGANGAYDGGYDMPGLNAPDNAAPDNSGWDAFDQMDASLGAYDVNDPAGLDANQDFGSADAGSGSDWGGGQDAGTTFDSGYDAGSSFDSGGGFDSGASFDSGGGFDGGGGDSGGGGGDS